MLTFDPVQHHYHFDGKRVPSVTQILDAYSDFSMINPEVLERKRLIGTAVHAAIEMDLKDELDYGSIDPVWEGYFNGWLKFKAQSGFVFEATEQRVFHKILRYAGTLDLLGGLPKAGDSLIDTKTCALLPRTAGPQTAAYREAIRQPKRKRFALQLAEDGSYKLEPLAALNDFAIFQSALTLYRWRNEQ
jgi:hypothetical protein